jgi:hypothetical protein
MAHTQHPSDNDSRQRPHQPKSNHAKHPCKQVEKVHRPSAVAITEVSKDRTGYGCRDEVDRLLSLHQLLHERTIGIPDISAI